MQKKCVIKHRFSNFLGPALKKGTEMQAENTLKVISKDPSFQQKKIGADRLRYFILNVGRHVQFCYFFHTNVVIFRIFTCFYLIFLHIGILMKFLVFKLSGTFNTIFRPEK